MHLILKRLVATYLALAIMTAISERLGIVRCGCDASCWCKTPGLLAFRWVLPLPHRSGDHHA